MSDSISTLAELKAASQTPTAARNRLTYLFDEGKFTELDAYAAAGDSLAGVMTLLLRQEFLLSEYSILMVLT